jgi:hypothetical protein
MLICSGHKQNTDTYLGDDTDAITGAEDLDEPTKLMY